MQLANLIFVNIIIAFVIDTYQSIDETLIAEREAKENENNKERNHTEEKQESVNSLLKELNDNPA